ncbi:MAG: hypothetical protein E6K98_06020 [Thaumarchaeota archaeon]|nr:MAG: hypothetical protein E6K98_06020 [Nitrososphaerota archaeon]TLX95894.1 MAG: hypothetical protein E6K91_01420 [Nitrososphaerota archaeon]
MLEANSFFTNMVDELVEFSEYDPELAEGLKWLDGEAQKRGITFYEMVFDVLHRYDVDTKAKDWLANRN